MVASSLKDQHTILQMFESELMKSYKSQQQISEPKTTLNSEKLISRLRIVESEIDNSSFCQYTRSLMNLSGYLRTNYQQFCRLQDELSKTKRNAHRSKQTIAAEIESARSGNQGMQAYNAKMKQRILQLEQPVAMPTQQQLKAISQLHTEIDDLSKQVDSLSKKNRSLNQAIKQPDMFAQYEQMCRECDRWRNINAKLTQELSEYIKEHNQKTGKDDNPNIILINLK